MSDRLGWILLGISIVLAALWVRNLIRGRISIRGRTGRRREGFPHGAVETEDALKAAYRLQDAQGGWTGEELARSLGVPEVLGGQLTESLLSFGWVRRDPRGLMQLTDKGRERAGELIRAHRLWERYLVEREQLALHEAHAEADNREHASTPEQVEQMDVELGHPAWDPHGHLIPPPQGQVPSSVGRSLLEEAAQGRRLRIISLDDNSPALLAQLTVMGLRPGVDVEVLEGGPELIRLRLDDLPVAVAAAAARHVSVFPAPALPVPLGELPVHSRVRVVEVQGSGKHQRRMLDMGFVPGAAVSVLRRAPLGDPVEYRVKGTAVSMRREDADTVLVEEL
ncbi:MAG: FeoA domain-containing protein [Spirochaetales bacterium]|nr:FeoA domain-containing protein [Spirochaetales bacterium]